MQKSLFSLCFALLLLHCTASAQSLSVERVAPVAVRVSNQVLFGKGQQYGGKFTDRVDIYDNSTGAWSSHDLSGQEPYAPSVVAGNKVIYYPKQFASNKLDIYDASTGIWSIHSIPVVTQLKVELVADDKVVFTGKKPNLPTIDFYIFNTSTGQWSVKALTQIYPYIGRILNKIMIVGGFEAFSWDPVNLVDIYDLDQNSWSQTTLSAGRQQNQPAILGNKIIFAGGRINLGNSQGANQVDIYDALANTWSLDTLPGLIGNCISKVVGTKAFFVITASPKNLVYIYEAVSATWSVHELLNNAYSFNVSTVGNQVLIAGGYTYDVAIGGNVYFNTVEIYDADADAWNTGALSIGRIPGHVVVKEGKVIYLGGKTNQAILALDVYDSALNQWSSYSSENIGSVFAVTDSKLYLAGGRKLLANGLSRPSEKTDIFDFSNGTWSSQPIQTPRIGLSMAAFPDKVLIAGGRTEIAPGFLHKATKSVEIFHD